MSDFDRRIGSSAPTLSFLDGPLVEDMLHDARTRLTKAVVIGQVGQLFSMGDIQWERIWPQTRLEMLHSYSQEQAHALEKSAYLAADPMTIQESRRVIAQAISDC